MKHLAAIALSALVAISASAAVTQRWTVETSRVQPVSFDAVRGESISLEATLQSYGKAVEIPSNAPVAIYWQTNGMASAWWTASASVGSNVLAAVFTPEMDVGAKAYYCYIGSAGTSYRAAFQIRFREGPGAVPNELPLPAKTIDFAQVIVTNDPWTARIEALENGSGGIDTNAVRDIVRDEVPDYETTSNRAAAAVAATNDFLRAGRSFYSISTDASRKLQNISDSGGRMQYPFVRVNSGGNLVSVYKQPGRPEVEEPYMLQHCMSWETGNQLCFDSQTPDDGMYFRSLDGLGGIALWMDGDYWNLRSSYTDWTWILNYDGTTMQDALDSKADSSSVYTRNQADGKFYLSAAGESLSQQVSSIGAHLNAEDARFVVTNYNSATHTPEAYVEIKLPDNSWSRIWSEMTRWDWLTGTYLPGNFYTRTAIDEKLADKADRAWGFYDSTTGAYAPDDYTWISSPNIAIAANLSYQRTVTTEGAIWVLESNGTVTETGGMTNGFFRISDDEGNSLFEIVKGDKRTVGADAASCQTVAGFTPTKLQISYSIVSDVHPTIYVCNSLSTQAWKAEDDADCVANVSWSGASGAWVAQVQGKSAYSSLYIKATYEVGGETYISNSAPVSMQYLMLNGVKYAVGTAEISGHTVLTLTVAP